MKSKRILLVGFMFLISWQIQAQLIGKNKDKKYLIYSTQVLGVDDLPNFGTINQVKMYFRDNDKQEVKFIIETLDNAEFMSGNMVKLGSDTIFPIQDEENPIVGHSMSEVTFTKSPWMELDVKKGLLHFISAKDQTRNMTAYIYFYFKDRIRILQLKGVVEDDIIELRKNMQLPSKKD